MVEMDRRRILVVDDEERMVRFIRMNLEHDGFQVGEAFNGKQAIQKIRDFTPDLILLDVMMPDIDGFEVLETIRDFSNVPVIMLTAKGVEDDRVRGLEHGADDYITKPFSPRELVARIRAMLRRPRTVPAAPAGPADGPPARVFGPLSIDVASRQVFLDSEPIALTRTEFDILAALSSRPGVVWSRRQLIDAVWGEPWVGNDHLVDVHVGHLRRKLADDPADPRFVFTVRGVGYRMGAGQ